MIDEFVVWTTVRILITGATGFIGGHLVTRLAGQHQVTAIVRSSHRRLCQGKVACVEMDLSRPLIAENLPAQMDVIVHLAQANRSFPEGANDLLSVNTVAAQQLLDYGRSVGARQFILASTGDVYGRRLEPCRETDSPAPTSYYANTKYSAEALARSYSEHVTACVLRLFQPFGPGQSSRLIPLLASRIRQQEPIRLNRGDRPHMTPTYVDDVIVAIERAIDFSFSGILNIAGDRTVSVRELANEIGSVLGRAPTFVESGEEVGDVIGDNTMMKQVLGEWQMVALTDGLRRTFGAGEIAA